GVIDNGCACVDGTTQDCVAAGGGSGTQFCSGGQFGPCLCVDGTKEDCVEPGGGLGNHTCESGSWGECTELVGVVGGSCLPGDVLAVPPSTKGCPNPGYTSPTDVLYCEDNGIWECSLGDDCQPSLCTSCIETKCKNY